MISYITRVHHLITVLMLLSQRSRDPDSLLLHWPQREGDCAIAGVAAADGDNADTWEGHTCTQTRSSRRESTRIRTHHHLSTPRPVLAPQILQRERSDRSESMHSTYPVSSEARPRALCLHTSKEREVAEFRENQQQQPLHTLRCHLKEQGKNTSAISLVNCGDAESVALYGPKHIQMDWGCPCKAHSTGLRKEHPSAACLSWSWLPGVCAAKRH